MIDNETNFIKIESEPFNGVTWSIVDHTTEDIGIGTIVVLTATDGSEDGSVITLNWLQGNDTVKIKEPNGERETSVELDDITAFN